MAEQKSNILIKNCIGSKGQSTVEYLLVLSVVFTIGASVFYSPWFKKILGPDSEMFAKMRTYLEYSYRHARPPSPNYDGDPNEIDDTGSAHESYFSAQNGTHFFLPAEPYP